MQRDEGKTKITAEDVISKLKDDGDFDTLRLKIIRKLKENVIPLPFLSLSLYIKRT